MAARPRKAPKAPRIPSYCLHRATGQAYLKLAGRVTYLGLYGSEASRQAYAAALADIMAGRAIQRPEGRPTATTPPTPAAVTVGEVCRRYKQHARIYYRKNGQPTNEAGLVAKACDRAAALFEDHPADRFGPLALKRVRDRMVEEGLARSTVNGSISRIRRAFKWAAAEELIPASVPTALGTVAGLRAGRTTARETAPILPVADDVVEATIPHLPEVVADMVRLQRFTGMRPGEVCALRPIDVDRSGEVWVYRPATHKTQHHGRERVVFIGPKAQGVLLRYLARDAEAHCFQPADSERKRRALMHAHRRTPISCGNRPGSNVSGRPTRPPGDRYTVTSYRQAITRACTAAAAAREADAEDGEAEPKVEPWTPNQLRHAAATEVRAKFGLEAAQVTLGHSTARVSEIYAEKNLAAGAMVALAIG
ncbi:tyrosine-type recombinase/integrase [Botrimarina mediterranea]|uniref:tyrosine-type recombinase/integrase n=1 Tax=Botrimarina mediterranea TaxID=2528022 RepID=UPI00118AE423|nr:site-specific tyrosine recombinase XerD [Planctomycetes bacterium K2D]